MPFVRRTAQAEDDLLDLWIYIAHDNPDAANRLLETEIHERKAAENRFRNDPGASI